MAHRVTRRQFLCGTAAAIGASMVAGTPTTGQAQGGKKVTVKLGHIAAADQPHGLAAQRLADLAKQYSNGEVEIQVFPSSQIGTEPQLFQGVKAGSIEMALQGEGTVAQPVPKYHWPIVPFMLKGPQHYEKVLTSELSKEMGEELLKLTGVRVLGDWYRSARQMGHRSKPVKTPQDARGQKLRVAEVPLYIDAYRDMGFAVTPMNWGELYGALQQGVVEMAEAQMEWFWGSKLFEVQKYLMLTNHCHGDYVVECNDKWWQALANPHQEAILRAVKEAGQYNMEQVKKWDGDMAQQLAGKGMIVVKPEEIDRAAFVKLVQEKAIPRYEAKWGKGFYDRIMKLA
jgi:tripartite ATP-independent transporter DctP family solute receptor